MELEYDLYYVKNLSPGFDFDILLATIFGGAACQVDMAADDADRVEKQMVYPRSSVFIGQYSFFSPSDAWRFSGAALALC